MTKHLFDNFFASYIKFAVLFIKAKLLTFYSVVMAAIGALAKL